jgi:L-alanine-DL-glutamate epimerase-like enolase superfamily enzyme
LTAAKGAALEAEQGGASPARPLAVNGLVSDLEGAEVEGLVEAGVTVVKLKVGRPDRLEEEAAAAGRLAQRFRLRLDANQAFAGRLDAVVDRWEALPLELFEEPAPWDEARRFAHRLPIGIDESVRGFSSPDAVSALPRAVVLKPTLLGSWSVVEAWARWAHARKCAVVFTHAYETEVGLRCLHRWAERLGSSEWAQGLFPHPFVGDGPVVERGCLRWP